jgi:hypothetical protein
MMLPLLLCCALPAADPPAASYFKITVVDEQTGRGVPLVELRTVNDILHVTDSNGVIAFHEPGLMGQKVFFHVRSHGYEFPKDGFGYRGTALDVKEGGSATLKLKQLNIAERLYRVTGAGIYRDSVLLGLPVPLDKPVLNAKVFGSDTVMSALYRGKIYWFWGDTNRPAHPLGNFEVPGATSELPAKGGLDPRLGINLAYFVDDSGFARKMTAIPGTGPTWITSLVVLPDGQGRERMFAVYVKVKGALDIVARGLAEFDDQKLLFERVAEFDLKAPIQPAGHTFLRAEGGVDYVYFARPFPLVRVRALPAELAKQASYQGFTCLKEGSTLDKPQLDRDANGRLRYAWKTNTPALSPKDEVRLLKKGLLKPGEALLPFQDADTGQAVQLSSGSVYWNDYRKRWVLIAVQNLGTSALGEVWYAEADTPVGPWVYGRKVVTHDKYSFYNPKQHPLFDRGGGRWILFEGTYTHSFSGNDQPTPRYDYNQIMYQLDLADERLVLPVPVYQVGPGELPQRFAVGQGASQGKGPRPLAFFALDRPRPGAVAVVVDNDDFGGVLRVVQGKGAKAAVFYALPADMGKPPATATPLYEFVNRQGKQRAYSVDAGWSRPGFERQPQPVCLVWKQPLRFDGPWVE